MDREAESTGRVEKAAAERPSRFSAANYLYVIAALIAVVCLSVGLALAYGSENLSTAQTWFLAGFLVIFSAFSVAIVIWLVVRHSRELAVTAGDAALQWRVTSSEKQRRRLNIEIRELGGILKVGESQLADLRAAYIVAEDLALRHVQNETGTPLLRKVTLGAADFDGISVQGDLVTCVSVLFLVRPVIPQEKVNRLFREAATARNMLEGIRKGSRVRLLLMLVTQMDRQSETRLRSTVADNFKTTPVDVDIKWMDFQKLQKLYSDD